MPSQTYILYIETATEVCSVCLSANGKLVSLREQLSGMVHSEKLAVFIDELFKEAGITASELSAIALSSGPGSYTGLRISTAMAKGMCYPFSIPLISVNTLACMATFYLELNPSLVANTLICPMLDARRNDVYTAVCDSMGYFITEILCIDLSNNSFPNLLQSNPIIFIGNGAEKASKFIDHPNATFIPTFKCSSKGMVKLSEQKFLKSEFENLAYFEPGYLKEAFVTKPKGA